LKTFLASGVVFLVIVGAVVAQSASTTGHILPASQIKWGQPPPALEKGASFAVISGDPGTTGPFVIRLKMPAGYKIAPHWHPTEENVTVISGTWAAGMGDKFDTAALTNLGAGGFGRMPAEMRHFAMAKTAAVVQVHGMGPFAINYVNAADDPRLRTR
jgi:hypothetical protein